jgi:hypothetical protein
MPPKKILKKKGSPVDEQRLDVIFKGFRPKEHVEISPKDGWVLPNRVKFSKWVHDEFVYPKDVPTQLFPSQRFVKDFIQYQSPYRGVLLFHALGVGKSCASIVSIENIVAYKDVTILLPASLRTNYIEEIKNRCGNIFFSKNQNWKFVHSSAFKDSIELASTMSFVSMAYIKKNQGLWIPTNIETPNWESLSNLEKQEINKQLDHMIESKYTFINYNGINGKKIDEMIKNAPSGNPFDNKIIIIDEVHNLISRTVGSGRIGKRIYELLLMAKDIKLIMLSGTPMINYPFEVSYIINLAKGPQETYKLIFKTEVFDVANISKLLDEDEYIDNYNIDTVKKEIEIQLAPFGFKFANKKEFLVKREETVTRTEDILRDIRDKLSCSMHGTNKIYYILPLKKEDFNEAFIDFKKEEILNPRMLARRMAGCISYVGILSDDKYPKVLKTEIVNLKMSPHQFNIYQKNRFEERKREDSSKKRGRKPKGDGEGDLFKSTGQVYRTFSRANCNFVFPEEIKRPYPDKLGGMLKELDILEGDELPCVGEDCDEEATTSYQNKIQKALNSLKKNENKYLTGAELESLSPKFVSLVPKLNNCPGKALVYSQFRTVEGLGILSLVLDANGWTEFKVKKTATGGWELDIKEEDMKKPKYFQYYGGEDHTKLIMKIFNNDLNDVSDNIKNAVAPNNLDGDIVKLIMITQSGAEGISLKHVREVHVMEPYWNEVRIQQVIGRAIRANSHVELPPAKRNVSVYRYLVSLTTKQLKDSKTIQNKDDSMTTDEYINNIAQRKARIIGAIQDLMKGSSVDCLVDSSYRDKTVKCIGFPSNINPNELSYNLEIEREETDLEYKQKVTTKISKTVGKMKKCVLNGVPYAYDTTTNILYDYNEYTSGKLLKVGKLVPDLLTNKMRLVK